MKKLLSLCFATFVIMLTSISLFAAEMAIEHVYVYPRGAQIRLKANVTGEGKILLPNTFDLESISVIPEDGLLLEKVQIVVLNDAQWLPPSLVPLQLRLEDKKRELSSLKSQAVALKQWSALIESSTPADLSVHNLESYLQAAEESRQKKEQERAAVESDIERVEQEITDIKGEIEEKKPQTQGKVIAIEYKTLTSGSLFIEGWTPHARWVPEYSLSLSTNEGRVEGQLLAKVRQHTGLIWNGIIQLHTAQPVSSVETPDIPPLVATFTEPLYGSGAQQNGRMLKTMAVEETAIPSAVEETITDRFFTTKGKISGDNMPVTLLLRDFTMPATVSIECIPLLSSQAWIMASSEAIEDPLLPGKADLFIDGMGSGRTRLPALARGEKLTLAFGQTPSVTATREEIIPKEGSNWFGKGKLAQGYTLNITNGLPFEAELMIKDRIPVSAHEKITVEVETLDPQPAEKDEKKGLLTWKKKFKAGEQWQISVVYRLSFPSDKEIWLK